MSFEPHDFDYYDGSDIELPIHPKKPRLASNPTPDDYRTYANELDVYESDMVKFKTELQSRRAAKKDRLCELKTKLASHYDLTPAKLEVLFDAAMEYSGGEGAYSIYVCFDRYYNIAVAFAEA
jgi:hypothetical protein